MNPRAPLGAAATAALESADRARVASVLGRLPITGTETWLDPSNAYALSASDQLRLDQKAVPTAQEEAFADYVAAAAFVHAADSWAYLGRALSAVLSGDVHGAVHLCYYAELRAALSLMSAEGIYVGNGITLALTGSGTSSITTEGTHVAAWKCLDKWGTTNRARDLFGAIIRPIGAPLHEWASAVPGGIQHVIADLVGDIAFDLSSFANDRERRNHVSYQPTRVHPDDLLAPEAAAIVDDVWTVLEPESRGTFPVLDRLLLSHILRKTYAASHSVLDDDGNDTGDTDWSDWVGWIGAVAPASAMNDPYFADLQANPHDATRDAAMRGVFTRSAGPVSAFLREMILRTTVLTRLATGACVELLSDSSLADESIATWADGLGFARALWEKGDAPDPLIDLWADALVAKEELENAPKESYHSIVRSMREYLAVLGQAERVAVWSFAS